MDSTPRLGIILTDSEIKAVRRMIYESEENVRAATCWWYGHGFRFLVVERTAEKSVYQVRKGNREITYSVPHDSNFSLNTFVFCFLETWSKKKGA